MVRRLGWIAAASLSLLGASAVVTGCSAAEVKGSFVGIACAGLAISLGGLAAAWLARLDSGASAGEEWLP